MQKNYYAIIPANIRYDKELINGAKLLYGEITALCNEKGFCWASNAYFSELYGVSKVSISKWINQLVEKGYLTSDIQYKEGTKEILNRYLRIVNDPIKEKLNTPIKEKFKDNITSINTTTNIYSNDFEQFWSLYPRKVDKKKAYKSFKTALKSNSLQTILEGTQKYAKQVQKTEPQFIKHPSTFLNNESFVDGYEEQPSVEQPKRKENESVLAGIWSEGY